MSNEIVIRTNKGEYKPGETVYGAVYLQVISPTAGTGIRLLFKVSEEFTYQYNAMKGNSLTPEEYSAKTNYTEHTDVLHRTQDGTSYRIGYYQFPFQKELFKDLPGSFFMEGLSVSGVSWKAEVSCFIQTQVIGAMDVQDTQTIVIRQVPLSAEQQEKEIPVAVDEKHQVRYMLIRRKSLHVTSRLIRNVFKTGEPMAIRIIITNPTSLTLTSLIVQLYREVTLKSRTGLILHKQDPCVKLEEDGKVSIQPEDGLYLVSRQEMNYNDASVFKRVLDNVLIPLREAQSHTSYPPSTKGQLIVCKYYVHIEAKLSNGCPLNVKLQVPAIIAEDNSQWRDWSPPDWISFCDTEHYDSPFSVSEHILRSEAFLNVPGFQHL